MCYLTVCATMEENRNNKISSRDKVRKHRAIQAEINEAIEQRSRYIDRMNEHENVGRNEFEDGGNAQALVLQNPNEAQHEIAQCSYAESSSSLEYGEYALAEEHENAERNEASEASTFSEGEEIVVNPRMFEAENENIDEVLQLRRWAVSHNIQQNTLSELLLILRRRLLPQLPKSAKTFLQTGTATYDILPMEAADNSMGEFIYFGIAKGLDACVLEDLHVDGKVLLQINVDGIKLFNSGTQQFWPILCRVLSSRDIYKPFIVGLYCGNSKPLSPEAFLHNFVQEINHLLAEGIVVNGRHLEVGIHSFICDTPARSFLKGTKGHGGFYACERCEIKGERIDNRTVYTDLDARERTDRSFRLKSQPEHHHYDSPLLAIEPSLNMVSQFILDYMHLCCEGVMKKLLDIWVGGKLQNCMRRRNKLGNRQQQEISNMLQQLRRCIPLEFQRRPKSLRFVAQWKATEFRYFLLYCGPIVLRGILNPELYVHFLLFHVACRILCSTEFAFRYNALAKEYLRAFSSAMALIYGRQSQIINVHNLAHLADDVRNMNCTLNAMSAFPFESALGQIKKLLRSANRPMAQICRRLHELSTVVTKPRVPPPIQILRSKVNQDDNTIDIQRIKYKGFILTTTFPNNLVILESGVILRITKMTCPVMNQQNIRIIGNRWKTKRSIFKRPTESAELKMWQFISRPSREDIGCSLLRIERKMVQLEVTSNFGRGERKIFGIPFLHE